MFTFNARRCLSLLAPLRAADAGRQQQQAVFDRHVKRLHKQRSASCKNAHIYGYLREHVASIVCDRIEDLNISQRETLSLGLDIGTGSGHVARHLPPSIARQLTLIQCDSHDFSSPSGIIDQLNVSCDEEALPFKTNSFDIIVSSCSMHWVNKLPATFRRIYDSLRPDSAFIGALLGGDTLHELRTAFQLAELERLSGFAAHVSPMTGGQDVAGLLGGAGFRLVTVDVDELRVHYPSMLELMFDLQGMGENNAIHRASNHLHRDAILAANAAYYQTHQDLFVNGVTTAAEDSQGLDRQGVAATFQIIHFIGWKEPKEAQKDDKT